MRPGLSLPPDFPWTHGLTKDDLKCAIFQPPPFKCGD